MTKLKRKIIKDIYNGHITGLYSFFENYIFSKDDLPTGFSSEFIDASTKTKCKYYMINDRDLADKYLREFSHWVKFLSLNGYIKTEPEKLSFSIVLVYKNYFLNKYISYSPYFANFSFLQVVSFIVNHDKLQKYISNGFRTEDEYLRFKKILRERILFKYIPWLAILITLGLTIYSTFFKNNDQRHYKVDELVRPLTIENKE